MCVSEWVECWWKWGVGLLFRHMQTADKRLRQANGTGSHLALVLGRERSEKLINDSICHRRRLTSQTFPINICIFAMTDNAYKECQSGWKAKDRRNPPLEISRYSLPTFHIKKSEESHSTNSGFMRPLKKSAFDSNTSNYRSDTVRVWPHSIAKYVGDRVVDAIQSVLSIVLLNFIFYKKMAFIH